MKTFYILDDNDEPMEEPDVIKWGQWLENNKARRILADNTIGNYRVVTIFTGYNFNIFGEPLLLYETAVMPIMGIHQRHQTKEEALDFHLKIVAALRLKQ